MANDGPRWTRPEGLEDSGITVMNSLTNEKDTFLLPDKETEIRWYQCGPTVYDVSHLGHARTYLALDCIRRILTRHFGYKVNLVQNVTDIDDKIINKFAADQEGPKEYDTFLSIARKFEGMFNDDMATLGVEPPTQVTHVSNYVPQIVEFIAQLLDRDMAYCAPDGAVYFNVHNFVAAGHRYGKLEPLSVTVTDEATPQPDGRQRPEDFALWKVKEGEPDGCSWDPEAEVGRVVRDKAGVSMKQGRPGWHIECSVMASSVLCAPHDTATFDVHCGGIDLRFPHHDNELAQSEAYHGNHQWCNYFMHCGSLTVQTRRPDGASEDVKMSKSLHNFVTIADALETVTPAQVRFMLLSAPWHEKFRYSAGHLEVARAGLRRIRQTLLELRHVHANLPEGEPCGLVEATEAAVSRMDAHLRDNFGYHAVLSDVAGLMDEWTKAAQQHRTDNAPLSRAGLSAVMDHIEAVLDLLNLTVAGAPVPAEPAAAVQLRVAVRNWLFTHGQATLEEARDAMTTIAADAGNDTHPDTMQFIAAIKADAGSVGELRKAVLGACDTLRNALLTGRGVLVSDLPGTEGCTAVLLDGHARDQEITDLETKNARDAAKAAAKAADAAVKAAIPGIPVDEYFMGLREVYEAAGHRDAGNVAKTHCDVLSVHGPETEAFGLPATRMGKAGPEEVNVATGPAKGKGASMYKKYSAALKKHLVVRKKAGELTDAEKAIEANLGKGKGKGKK